MKISNIDASLKYGRFFTGKWLAFLYSALIIAFFIPLITIIMIFLTFFGLVWDNDMIFALAFCNVFSLSLAAICLWTIICNNKLRKRIVMWLEDAIEIKAFSKTLATRSFLLQSKLVKMKVRFKLADVDYVRDSAGKMLGAGKKLEGYHKIFVKYADRKINILYSSKYDQVLILKDKK